MKRTMARVFSLIAVLALWGAAPLYARDPALRIVHTNDLHSHLLGFAPEIDYRPDRTGADRTGGGWARLATAIAREKAASPHPVLVLDGGDFLMGSLFHTISREAAAELRLLKAMGYDAAAFGNHEFDLKPAGVAQMLATARSADGLPALVQANLRFSPGDPRDDALAERFAEGLVKPYIILDRDGLKIGIFGLLGRGAAEMAPFAKPLVFADPVETARRTIDRLRNGEKVDWVVCLSHNGLGRMAGPLDDVALAREAPGIDVIVGGHSHTRMETPLRVGDTVIVQAGANGRWVGVLDLERRDGRIAVRAYRSVPIDARIPADPAIQRRIEAFAGIVDQNVLKAHGLSFRQVIGETAFDLTLKEEESNLGNLMTDALVWMANRHAFDPADPATKVVMAVESNGVIRDDLMKGRTGALAVTDVFRAIPLGLGMDDTMGYPVIAVYLTGAEIKKALEVLTSIYPLKGDPYFLQVSGVRFTYNPKRLIFDRVTDIRIGSTEGGWRPLDTTGRNRALYRVAANLYNATFLKLVGDFTWQILKIVPKDRQGRPVENLADMRIDADPSRPGIQELKQWAGFVAYLRQFPDIDGDGRPDIPETYRGKLGRIVPQPSLHPVDLLAHGSWLTWTVFGAGLVILIGLVLGIRRLIRVARRRG